MPTVETLSLGYVLHELPPGPFPFRRWRFELWHGDRLVGAGWRVTQRDAIRALRTHGSRVGHRLFGMTPPPDVARDPSVPFLMPGAAIRLRAGAITFSLVPRALEGT